MIPINFDFVYLLSLSLKMSSMPDFCHMLKNTHFKSYMYVALICFFIVIIKKNFTKKFDKKYIFFFRLYFGQAKRQKSRFLQTNVF